MAIPMDQRDGWIWFDGELKPWKDAKIHVLTHGLHYASCVFEGQRAYGGDVFKLREHSNRLIQSGKSLSLPGDENCTELEYYFPEAAVRMQPEGVRVHMAVTCSVNCGDYYESSVGLRTMQLGDRGRVAEIPTECQIED